jgi:hypothetical protein
MSKYRPLSEHIASLAGDEWRASFAQIEAVLGATLPKAALQPTWWKGETEKPHHRAWLDHDWKVAEVAESMVTFRKDEIAHEIQPPVLKAAAETASHDVHARQALNVTAVVGGVVALVAGLGVLVAKAVKSRKV